MRVAIIFLIVDDKMEMKRTTRGASSFCHSCHSFAFINTSYSAWNEWKKSSNDKATNTFHWTNYFSSLFLSVSIALFLLKVDTSRQSWLESSMHNKVTTLNYSSLCIIQWVRIEPHFKIFHLIAKLFTRFDVIKHNFQIHNDILSCQLSVWSFVSITISRTKLPRVLFLYTKGWRKCKCKQQLDHSIRFW